MLANDDQTEALVATFKRGSKLKYNKSEFIIRPGDTPSGVFYIETGLVKAYDVTKYGEENLLIVRKAGEIFPLIWGITGQERSIIYQALVPTEVWRISRKLFSEYLNSPTTDLSPILNMTIEMYRLHSERIINLGYRSVRERLISFLLTLSYRFGKPHEDGGIIVDVPLRQQDVASSINASRETTSRELSALEKKGLIFTHPHYIILKDMDKLRGFL
jgi:CRP/FNR family transcriptional regulator, cyclic AMP receptor protein